MEEIVVAGISGRLPESDNLEEFWQNLFNGVDMVTEDERRWKPGILQNQIYLSKTEKGFGIIIQWSRCI